MKFDIRKIEKKDNLFIKKILINVMNEYGVPSDGTALADVELNHMYESYLFDKHIYYILNIENKIVGGAGIAPLKNSDKNICELQKMYFLTVARGKGLGSLMIKKCIDFASKSKFQYCYIETMHNMIKAQKLYKSYGFEFIESPLGNTGHSSCPVWMLKKL